MATSLLTGSPAPSPLLSTGPSDDFSCHVSPSMLMAAHGEERQTEGERGGCERTQNPKNPSRRQKTTTKKTTLRVSSAINTANRAAIVLVSQGEREREKKNMLNKVAGDLQHKKKKKNPLLTSFKRWQHKRRKRGLAVSSCPYLNLS